MFLAIKRLTITTLLCMTFFALFGVSVYAESDNFVMGDFIEETTSEDVLEHFNYNEEFLIELVEVNEAGVFSGQVYSSYDVELYRSEFLKNLGALELSTGFERDRLTTFATTKAITGVGVEGAVVGLHVFHIISDSVVSTQDSLVTLGKSGLYNETVCFDHVGVNYVLLTVEDPETFASTKRLYKVTVKELETRNKLENMTIDFFEEEEESPTIEKFVPEIVNFGF